jgi:ribonuclease HII
MALKDYERELHASGYRIIAGIDEAGRGTLAGAVVAAAVVLPLGARIEGLRDSKQLRPKQRERLFPIIHSTALGIGIGIVDEKTIDRINILRATLLAMERAVSPLQPRPDFLLIDGNQLPSLSIPALALPKGESHSPSIAAASIVAKVTRDRLMALYHEIFPCYGFIQHKGYGTADHLRALREYGPCPIHRRTFKGVKELLPNEEMGDLFGEPHP